MSDAVPASGPGLHALDLQRAVTTSWPGAGPHRGHDIPREALSFTTGAGGATVTFKTLSGAIAIASADRTCQQQPARSSQHTATSSSGAFAAASPRPHARQAGAGRRRGPGQSVGKGATARSRTPAAGDRVEVTAVKKARRSDPASVQIKVVEHAGGVTICAVYPTREGRAPNECRPGEAGRMSAQDNDVNVIFTVSVPAGVGFVARTVNGGVEADGLTGDVDAHTVTRVRLSTAARRGET